MNRRSFFTSMAALPFIGALAKAADFTPKPTKIKMNAPPYGRMGNPWAILTPQEITRAGFVLVTTPVFIADDQNYCIKTKQLHLWLPPERVEEFTSCGAWRSLKEETIRLIKQIGFTHVYSVRFNESPIYNPTTFKSLGHMALVRGATIHWYPGSIYEQAVNRA